MGREFIDHPPTPSLRLRFSCSGLGVDAPSAALGTPDGHYSRLCWLPVVGPTAWVLWGTIASELDADATIVYEPDDLTDAIGLGRTHRLTKALKRLDRLGVASSPAANIDDPWHLPAASPPLELRHHATVSAEVRRFHHQTIANLDNDSQQPLHEIFTSTYIDHFGGHQS